MADSDHPLDHQALFGKRRWGLLSAKNANPSIAPLLAVTFVGTLGFSIVTPFLVVLVTQWGGNAVVYGILAATYSFFQLFGAPALGKMSDRMGRRRLLLLSQLGTLLSWIVFLVAFALPDGVLFQVSNPWFGDFVLTLPLLALFFARAADGLTGGNVSVSNAYLSDITAEEDRTRNFGRMAVASNLGFVVGPAVAGLLGATVLGAALPVIAAVVISAIALGFIQFGLVEAVPKPITKFIEEPSACDLYGQEKQSAYKVEGVESDGIGAILALPRMPVLMVVNFLVMLGFSFFYVAFPVHAIEVLDWGVTQIGLFFALLSVAMILVQGPVLARLGETSGDRALMSFGGACLALGFAAFFFPRAEFVYAGAALIALGNGLMWPTFMAVLSKAACERLQGAVQGYRDCPDFCALAW
nr:MFS transporter [Marinicella sp. W31]MDC2876107.1 MFS transporter [Marinicella sp. W31]